METLITQPREPSGSPEAAASSPGWVMLGYYNHNWASDSTTVVCDGMTCAAAKTSKGRSIQVSFNLVAPPGISTFYFNWVGGAPDGNDRYKLASNVITAHNNCIIFQVNVVLMCGDYRRGSHDETDYFLYEACAAGQPPSLSLLPACFFSRMYHRQNVTSPGLLHIQNVSPDHARSMRKDCTGLLRCGDDGLMVVELELPYGDDNPRNTAELCMLWRGEWELRVVPIIFPNAGKPRKLMEGWSTDVVVPVADRFLCWVDYLRGFLLGDMAEDTPELRYIPLPFEPPVDSFDFDRRPNMKRSRSLGAAGAASVKFVTVESRCCCGGPGRTTCVRGRFAFTVTTWTLNLTTKNEPMAAWVKDGMLDCEELWPLPGYKSLPRVPVEYPIVSVDDPDVVCFTVCSDYRSYLDSEVRKVWFMEVDMRSKALRSVVPCTGKDRPEGYNVPLKLQH
ncbi:hypothetical protein EJB05_57953, partial [Eragrostis curvula]